MLKQVPKKPPHQQQRFFIAFILGTIFFLVAGMIVYDQTPSATETWWILSFTLPPLLVLWLPLSWRVTAAAMTTSLLVGAWLTIWSQGSEAPIIGLPHFFATAIIPAIYAIRLHPPAKIWYYVLLIALFLPLAYFAVFIMWGITAFLFNLVALTGLIE